MHSLHPTPHRRAGRSLCHNPRPAQSCGIIGWLKREGTTKTTWFQPYCFGVPTLVALQSYTVFPPPTLWECKAVLCSHAAPVGKSQSSSIASAGPSQQWGHCVGCWVGAAAPWGKDGAGAQAVGIVNLVWQFISVPSAHEWPLLWRLQIWAWLLFDEIPLFQGENDPISFAFTIFPHPCVERWGSTGRDREDAMLDVLLLWFSQDLWTITTWLMRPHIFHASTRILSMLCMQKISHNQVQIVCKSQPCFLWMGLWSGAGRGYSLLYPSLFRCCVIFSDCFRCRTACLKILMPEVCHSLLTSRASFPVG